MDFLDVVYDISSIMYYGKYVFNKNGRFIIEVIGYFYVLIG